MLKVIVTMVFLVIVSCADRSEQITVTGIQGPAGPQGEVGAVGETGTPGTSCSTAQSEGGSVITCADGTYSFIANGSNAPSLTPQDYQLTSECLTISDNFSAKALGGGAKVYATANCSGQGTVMNPGQNNLWVSNTELAFAVDGNILRTLNFN